MEYLKKKVEDQIKQEKERNNSILTWFREGYNTKDFNEFITQIDEKPPKGIIVNDGRNELIRINDLFQKDLMIKKFNLIRTYDKLRFCVLDSKAIRSLRIALALEEIRVKTPKPIAVVEKRGRFNQLLYSYYITEYVDFDYNLLDIVAQEDHPRRDDVKKLLPEIANDVRKMHKAGIVHNDLHAGNILVKDIDNNPKFHYIDLNRGRIKKDLSSKQQIKDLARFKLTREEQKIFMKAYAPENYNRLLDLMIKQRRRRKEFLNFKRSLRSKLKFWK